jgi:hypothetical protein
MSAPVQSSCVSVRPDPNWFRAVLAVPSAAMSEGWLDELAAAFAEDPERVGDLLLELHALNQQVDADVADGNEALADDSAGQAMDARRMLADLLPVDVEVHLDEVQARELSAQALAAGRKAYSARLSAGYDPLRAAEPLATTGRRQVRRAA